MGRTQVAAAVFSSMAPGLRFWQKEEGGWMDGQRAVRSAGPISRSCLRFYCLFVVQSEMIDSTQCRCRFGHRHNVSLCVFFPKKRGFPKIQVAAAILLLFPIANYQPLTPTNPMRKTRHLDSLKISVTLNPSVGVAIIQPPNQRHTN